MPLRMQVLPERGTIDQSLMMPWDVPVDVIVTPTRVSGAGRGS